MELGAYFAVTAQEPKAETFSVPEGTSRITEPMAPADPGVATTDATFFACLMKTQRLPGSASGSARLPRHPSGSVVSPSWIT